jgi:23S rRNA (cytidine1920-2'-O)/16S rRNA (cytidine1409-2'-O)-methyltransferase
MPLVVIESKILRGSRKLAAALNEFQVGVNACVCLDLGASTGGFTQELLNRGARRVYAVDVGHGQLRGVLRQDRRVINLERTNLAELSATVVPEEIDLMTADLSYIALHVAIGQVVDVRFSRGARLVALVKPQFELGLASAPRTEAEYLRAVALARKGIEQAGWRPLQSMRSPHSGAGGAIEYFLLAARG